MAFLVVMCCISMSICDKFCSNNNFGALPSIQSGSAEFEYGSSSNCNSSVKWENGWKSWDHVGFLGENWEMLGYFKISNDNVANGNRTYFQDGF